MIKELVVLALVILWPGLAMSVQPEGAQEESEPGFKTYIEMRERFGALYAEGKLEEGAELLEWALPRFPDNVVANSFNLAIVSCSLGRLERAMETLEYSHERDLWFNSYAMSADVWAPLREFERFGGILERNEELRQEAQKTSVPDMLVVTPEGYEEGTDYPLFIALHGGGGNIAGFRDVWVSERLGAEFIVAYLQSSLLVSMDSYDWMQDMGVTRTEIADAYRSITEEYRVAEDAVIIGGFSSGGAAALAVAMVGAIPLRGFVALCPRRPDEFTEANVAAAHQKGLRGSILTTEMDPALDAQREMVGVLESAGMLHRLVVTPDIGHWIPEDLGAQIDGSIGHILGD